RDWRSSRRPFFLRRSSKSFSSADTSNRRCSRRSFDRASAQKLGPQSAPAGRPSLSRRSRLQWFISTSGSCRRSFFSRFALDTRTNEQTTCGCQSSSTPHSTPSPRSSFSLPAELLQSRTMPLSIEQQIQVLSRRAERILTEEDLRRKLASGRKLRIKI